VRPKHGHFEKRTHLKHGAVCTLGVFIDHTYLHNLARGSTSVAVSKVVHHVAEADFIFRTTDMGFDGVPDNIGFEIGGYITLYGSANHRVSDTSVDVTEFISRFSSNNFDEFCLALAFTYRDFG